MKNVKNFPKCFGNLPRNKNDYYGGLTLFSVANNTFFQFSFGCGDNLDAQDIKKGYDDYLNYSSYSWDGRTNLLGIFDELKQGSYLDEIDGLDEKDGGMMLIRRSDYSYSGDIRMYLENALDMAGYGIALIDGEPLSSLTERLYSDLIFVASTDE